MKITINQLIKDLNKLKNEEAKLYSELILDDYKLDSLPIVARDGEDTFDDRKVSKIKKLFDRYEEITNLIPLYVSLLNEHNSSTLIYSPYAKKEVSLDQLISENKEAYRLIEIYETISFKGYMTKIHESGKLVSYMHPLYDETDDRLDFLRKTTEEVSQEIEKINFESEVERPKIES